MTDDVPADAPDPGASCTPLETDEFAPLLAEPFATAWASRLGGSAEIRGRLLGRVAASHAGESGLVTVRQRRTADARPAPGVRMRTLYAVQGGETPAPGEACRVCLATLEAGAVLATPDEPALRRELLVLEGTLRLDEECLGTHDYHADPAGWPAAPVRASTPARLFMRWSRPAALPDDRPFTVRDAEAGWPEFGPGIRRRVLWSRGGQAALLYQADPGAAVPRHVHGHAEECFMVRGELFLDDLLLQAGDFQLAPAGTSHASTVTDTGVVVYAHGDLDLRFTR